MPTDNWRKRSIRKNKKESNKGSSYKAHYTSKKIATEKKSIRQQ